MPNLDDRGYTADQSSVASSLLARLRAREPVAWRGLLHVYGPLVYRWCRQAGVSPEDARDVGQEVFRTLARKLADFRRERSGDSFRGWLWTITRTRIIDHWRRQGEVPAAGGSDAQRLLANLPEEDPEPEESERLGQTGLLVRRGLDLIRDEFEVSTWQAFWRVTVEGEATADVAAALGLSANAVRVAKCKVLRRLREELGELEE